MMEITVSYSSKIYRICSKWAETCKNTGTFLFKEPDNKPLNCQHRHWWIGGSCWRHIRAKGDLGGVSAWGGGDEVSLKGGDDKKQQQQRMRWGFWWWGLGVSSEEGNLGRPEWGVPPAVVTPAVEGTCAAVSRTLFLFGTVSLWSLTDYLILGTLFKINWPQSWIQSVFFRPLLVSDHFHTAF